ncbi:hypothetical protein DFH08DRAFT_97938 [Mycena albidolilacea]|uniref:Uncharacterized protein n=1 Tax=Mycena albidolilacea TaxID=1033008 RepID=A0AAD7A8A6_9AGAR|nr:hypothetical protein DFH08DRAFT_97938 [Mycena albidolilacea]
MHADSAKRTGSYVLPLVPKPSPIMQFRIRGSLQRSSDVGALWKSSACFFLSTLMRVQFNPSSCIMGHVAYVHHYTYYLPTFYVAVLMLAHLLDRFIFSSHHWRQQTKVISLGSVVSCFWWVRAYQHKAFYGAKFVRTFHRTRWTVTELEYIYRIVHYSTCSAYLFVLRFY